MIDILKVRKRPGMYIGDTADGSGLHHMIWEILGNSLDEHMAGYCQYINVRIEEDGAATIEDDGRGIPVTLLDGLPFAQVALTRFHITPTLDGHAPHEHVGLFGVGLCPVNALSSWLRLDIYRDGHHYRQFYERGTPATDLDDAGPADRTGTCISFLPDPTIFADPWFNAGVIASRLRELSALVPAVTLSFADHRTHTFHEPRGLQALVERRRTDGESIGATFVVNETFNDIRVEAAASWYPEPWRRCVVESYANIERTTGGGAHVDGLLRGLVAGLQTIAGGQGIGEKLRESVSRGLYAIVCVRLNDPSYRGPTKDVLTTPRARSAVQTVVGRAFADFLRHESQLVEHLTGERFGGR